MIIPHDRDSDVRNLTERERTILRAIVHLYVLHAAPIGSRYLSKYLEREFRLSPATIRNAMVDLEELGYITHPHSSAGRVPTDRGYRLYVDSLMDIEHLTNLETSTVVSSLLLSPRENILRDASRLLGSLSHYLALVQSPILRDVIVRKVEMIDLSSERILVVLALESDIVRTLSIETSLVPERGTLEDLSRFVNERLSGHTLREIPTLFPDILNATASDSTALVRLFLEEAERMADIVGGTSDSLHVAGTPQLLSHPEFEHPERVRSIIELIENQEVIVHLLDSGVGSTGVRVRIGDELDHEGLKDYSLITTQYRIGSMTGSVGLVGPKRMQYGKMIALVDFVSNVISSKYDGDVLSS